MDEFKEQADGYFQSYKQFSNMLRSWLIAYGIGAPILILSQDHIWDALKDSVLVKVAGVLFLLGVLLQIVFTAFFKWAMWVVWMATDDENRRNTRSFKIADWASEKYFIDFVTDIGAILLFAVATIIVFAKIL